MSIKLIASDMDGTLFRNGRLVPEEEDFRLISDLADRGVLFAAASGRPYPNLRRIFAPVWDKMVFIADNGTNVLYKDRLISRTPMERGLAFSIIDSVLELDEDVEIVVCTRDGFCLLPKSDTIITDMVYDWNMTVRAVRRKQDIIDDILKLSIYMRTGISKAVEDRITNLWQGRVGHIAISGKCWLDLQDGDKGLGLLAAAEYFGLTRDEIAAFGDNFNDVEMLSAAGHSYVMFDAPEDVKKYGNHMCMSVRQSVSEILEDMAEGKNDN